MDVLALVLGPAVLAGGVAVAVTVAIERLGGVAGGLLGTLPTTIVPASIGIWFAAPEPQAFAAAMGAVPAGMLVDAGFLWLWRALPHRLPAWGLGARLTLMSVATLVAWAVLAALAVAGLSGALRLGLPPLALGAVTLVAHLVIGVAACWKPIAAPRGSRRVGLAVLFARSLLAGTAIAVSTLLALWGDDLLAGIASVFPAIFLTTMVALWISQGEAVPAGAVGPMMLGAAAVGAYALLAAALLPWLGLGAAFGLAWLGAAGGVTVPAWAWLRSRIKPHP